MAKQRKQEEAPAGCAPWMATFGDLMNLLLCFFVLLFSMSSVDAQKFELIAASFSESFSIFSGGSKSIGEGAMLGNGISQTSQLDNYLHSLGRSPDGNVEPNDTEYEGAAAAQSEVEAEQLQRSEELAELIEEALQENEIADEVQVNFNSQYVELTLNGSLLFDSGSDILRQEVIPIMEKVGMVLQRYAESGIEIEGHTDNVPIHNSAFSNNDELSSFRALAVFNYLKDNTNIDPAKIKHSGRGEYVPVADNATPEGRAKNRRVGIKIYHSLSAY